MSTHVCDDLADALKQSGIIQHWLAHRDAVLPELVRIAYKPSSVSQRAHRNRSVIGRHAAEFVSCHQCRASA